jgi:hypothetical protein
MSPFSLDELKTLVEQTKGLCVSIYMPISVGADVQQNPIRFKNLIKRAESSLVENGLSDREALEILQLAQEAIDRDENFWQQQDRGLAVFLAPEVCRYYRLPPAFEELVVVTDRFYLKPLLPFLKDDRRFYILALSQQDVRLFEGTQQGIEEIKLEGVPRSLDQALQYDETAKDGQFRISTSKGGTNNSFQHAGVFHGQGSPDRDDIKKDIGQYFHAIDSGLHKYLQGKKAPLLLAGVEYLMPIYREANTYQYLIDDGITGNPENTKPEKLHAQAWEIVEPLFVREEQQAFEHYMELAGTGRHSSDIKEVVPAAYYGRIEQLFVANGVQQWGSFNPDTSEIDMHPEAELGDEDLLDVAAVQTILNGGTVYVVDRDKVPDKASVAAVFRY